MTVRNKVHVISRYPTLEKNWSQFGLQRLISNILLVAQCFAVLPVNGVRKDVESLEFKWITLKTVYSAFTLTLLATYSVFIISYSILKSGGNFDGYVVVAWNVRAFLGIIVFFRLARKWPLLMRQWQHMEVTMSSHGPPRYLRLRFRALSITFFVTGLTEHLTFVGGGAKTALLVIPTNNTVLETYFKTLYAEFFDVFEYAHWKAALVEFLALITTFDWQFCDLMVILLSCALATRFEQITRYIKANHQAMNEMQWRNLRKQFNTLSLLCKTLNSTMSEVVLLSFFGNVYFLSISVFQSFAVYTNYEIFYYWYGCLFNLFHFAAVCLYASWVYEESFEPVTDISSISIKNTCHETDRLLHQMASKEIAIYGAGLFKITRGMILNVASAIVTLQLIFVQFNAKMNPKIK